MVDPTAAAEASPRYISVAAAAAQLGVAEVTVRSLLGRSELEGIRVGRVIRVDANSIEAYRAANVYIGRQQTYDSA
jgi:excisionase family DNA binding protein